MSIIALMKWQTSSPLIQAVAALGMIGVVAFSVKLVRVRL